MTPCASGTLPRQPQGPGRHRSSAPSGSRVPHSPRLRARHRATDASRAIPLPAARRQVEHPTTPDRASNLGSPPPIPRGPAPPDNPARSPQRQPAQQCPQGDRQRRPQPSHATPAPGITAGQSIRQPMMLTSSAARSAPPPSKPSPRHRPGKPKPRSARSPPPPAPPRHAVHHRRPHVGSAPLINQITAPSSTPGVRPHHHSATTASTLSPRPAQDGGEKAPRSRRG